MKPSKLRLSLQLLLGSLLLTSILLASQVRCAGDKGLKKSLLNMFKGKAKAEPSLETPKHNEKSRKILRPEIPRELNRLLILHQIVRGRSTMTEMRAFPMKIPHYPIVYGVALFVDYQQKLVSTTQGISSEEEFEQIFREKVLAPCSQLDESLGAWREEVRSKKAGVYEYDEDWLTTEYICLDLIKRDKKNNSQKLITEAYGELMILKTPEFAGSITPLVSYHIIEPIRSVLLSTMQSDLKLLETLASLVSFQITGEHRSSTRITDDSKDSMIIDMAEYILGNSYKDASGALISTGRWSSDFLQPCLKFNEELDAWSDILGCSNLEDDLKFQQLQLVDDICHRIISLE